MSLLFIDGFDHYQTSDISEKWGQSSWVDFGEIRAGIGRRGTQAYYSNLDRRYLGKVFAPAPTWIIGLSLRYSGYLSGTYLIAWSDGSQDQCRLFVNSVGQIGITRGDDTLLGYGTVSMSVNTTYYLEWLLTVSNTAGVSRVRIDGIEVLTLTGIDTQVTGQAQANAVRLGNLFVAQVLWDLTIDDVYICDGAGSTHNTFLGDCRVDLLLPTGEGSYSAWTPSTGGAHYEMVNETPPNDDTDYLSTSTVAARDMHTFSDLGTMPSPLLYGVQHCVTARKDNAGTRQMKSLVKSGDTTAVGDTTHTLATTYVDYTQMYPTDPATGAAWTIAAVNGVEAGMEMTL